MADNKENLINLLRELSRDIQFEKKESDKRFDALAARLESLQSQLIQKNSPPEHTVQEQTTPPQPVISEPQRVFIPAQKKEEPPKRPEPKIRKPNPFLENLKKKFANYDWKQWELLIGTNWLSRIGMIVVALGVFFFMKYSFDQNFISPSVRIVLAILLGFSCFGAGERFYRKKYPAQAQVFIGGGSLILYGAVLVAKNFPFHSGVVLENSLLAIIFMVLVTAFTYLAALRYDSPVIAAIGMIGGFLAPLVVGKPSGQAAPLLFYLGILGLAAGAVEYKKGWRKLLLVTIFLAFIEPLVLRFIGSEQHAQLLLYLLMTGIGAIWIATRKGYEKFGILVLGCVIVVPVIAMLRTVGDAAHPVAIYSYVMIIAGMSAWLSRKNQSDRIFIFSSLAAYLLPLVLVNHTSSYVLDHRVVFAVVPFVYHALITTGLYVFAKRGQIPVSIALINLFACVIPVLTWMKVFRSIISPLGLMQTGDVVLHAADFISYLYVLTLVFACCKFARAGLVTLYPLTYLVIKMTIVPEGMIVYWPLFFITCGTLHLAGLFFAKQEGLKILAAFGAATGFIFPILGFVGFPDTIWILHIYIYGFVLLVAQMIASAHKGWRLAGVIAIIGAFIHPWMGYGLARFYVLPTYIHASLLLSTCYLASGSYFRAQNKEKIFAFLSLVGAASLPVMTRAFSAHLIHLPFVFYLALTLASYYQALRIADERLNLVALAFAIAMPPFVSQVWGEHTYLIAAYALILVIGGLFTCHQKKWNRMAVFDLIGAFLVLLPMGTMGGDKAPFIYALCGVLASCGFIYAYVNTAMAVALAATVAAFVSPVTLINGGSYQIHNIFIYSIIILVFAGFTSVKKAWRVVSLVALYMGLIIPIIFSYHYGFNLISEHWHSYMICLLALVSVGFIVAMIFGIKNSWQPGILISLAVIGIALISGLSFNKPLQMASQAVSIIALTYGAILLIPVLIIAYRKNWRGLGNSGMVLILIFGMSSMVNFKSAYDEKIFLNYLMITGAMAILLGLKKKWTELLALPFVGSAILSSFIFVSAGNANLIDYPEALLYLSAFFSLYFAAAFIHARQIASASKTVFTGLNLLLPVYYYYWLYQILKIYHPSLLGVAAIGLAAIYLVQTVIFMRAHKVSSIDGFKASPIYGAVLIWMGVVIALVTIAVPLQLDTRLITIAWATEAGLVMWAGFRLADKKVQTAGSVLVVLAFMRFVTKDTLVPGTLHHFFFDVESMSQYAAHYSPLVSTRFFSGLFISAMLLWVSVLKGRRLVPGGKAGANALFTAALFIFANVFLYALFCTEAGAYLITHTEAAASVKYREIIYSMIGSLHAVTILIVGFRFRNGFCRALALVAFALVVIKIFARDIWSFNEGIRIIAFILLGVLLLVSSLLYTRYRNRISEKAEAKE